MGAIASGSGVPHDINSITDIGLGNATVDEFCKVLEWGLDRPVVNETKLDGQFNFQVSAPERSSQQPPPHDFVERLREELGLAIVAAQRHVETTVYRLR
jgi:uncharacterized protein (TIGR03435 family)